MPHKAGYRPAPEWPSLLTGPVSAVLYLTSVAALAERSLIGCLKEMAGTIGLRPCDVEVARASAKHVGADLTLGVGIVSLGYRTLVLSRAGALDPGAMDSATASEADSRHDQRCPCSPHSSPVLRKKLERDYRDPGPAPKEGSCRENWGNRQESRQGSDEELGR